MGCNNFKKDQPSVPPLMKKTIFIDLDGTILDVSERIYQVYKDILRGHNKQYLSKKSYLKLKREKVPIEKILKSTGAENILLRFKKDWGEEIESLHYLGLDKVSRPKKKTLLDLKNNYRLILVTLRNHPRRVFGQLKSKKIDKIFDKVLISPGISQNPKWKLKYNLIKKYGNYNKDSIIIGDTETDVLTGKKLGIRTVAVVKGMRDRKFLERYKPDILIEDISKIKNILNK